MKKYFCFRIGVLLALIQSSLQAGVSFYVGNAAGFNAAASGLEFKGIENWEESILGGGLIDFINDPLAPGVANGVFATGSNVASGVTAQANTLGNNPTVTSTRGTDGLAVTSAGYIGTPSDQVSTNFYGDSLDLIVNPSGNYTGAISFNALYFASVSSSATSNPGNMTIRVYDSSNVLLGTQNLTAVDYSGGAFLGIVATAGSNIGRVNVSATSDPLNSAAGADNISVFGGVVPEPSVSVILLCSLFGVAKRRRSVR